jgi:HemY protein
MIRLIGFLILVAVIAVVAVWFVDHPGHVTMQWMDYRVEMTTAVGAVILLGLIIASALLYRFWHWLKRGPQALSEAWQGGARPRGGGAPERAGAHQSPCRSGGAACRRGRRGSKALRLASGRSPD